MLTAETIIHGNTRHGQSRSVATGKASPTYRTWVSMLCRQCCGDHDKARKAARRSK